MTIKQIHELMDDGPRAYATWKLEDLKRLLDKLKEQEENESRAEEHTILRGVKPRNTCL